MSPFPSTSFCARPLEISFRGFNVANGIVSGSGTSGDSYIIEDWYNIEIKKGVQITKSGFDFLKIPVRR
jgi:hypothetical protein